MLTGLTGTCLSWSAATWTVTPGVSTPSHLLTDSDTPRTQELGTVSGVQNVISVCCSALTRTAPGVLVTCVSCVNNTTSLSLYLSVMSS